MGSCNLSHASLKIIILLSRHPECWDYRHIPLYPVVPSAFCFVTLAVEPRASHVRQAFLLCILRQGLSILPRLSWNSLCSLGRPLIYNPPALVSQVGWITAPHQPPTHDINFKRASSMTFKLPCHLSRSSWPPSCLKGSLPP